MAPVLEPLDDVADDPAFQTADDSHVADPVVYSDWFDKAGEKEKKLAVGAKAYSLVKNQLGVEPSWEHFVDPTSGGLLSMKKLEREDIASRADRVNEMRQLLSRRRSQTQQVRNFGFVTA